MKDLTSLIDDARGFHNGAISALIAEYLHLNGGTIDDITLVCSTEYDQFEVKVSFWIRAKTDIEKMKPEELAAHDEQVAREAWEQARMCDCDKPLWPTRVARNFDRFELMYEEFKEYWQKRSAK